MMSWPPPQQRELLDSLESIFSRHGLPVTCKSDNGPQFRSKQFTVLWRKWHHTLKLLRNMLRPMERPMSVRTHHSWKGSGLLWSDGLDWNRELRKYVSVYRNIIHTTTGKAAEWLFNWKVRGKLPELIEAHSDQEQCDRDRAKGKEQAVCRHPQRSTAIRGQCWWHCALQTRQNGQILHHIQHNTTQDYQRDRKQCGCGIANRSEVREKHHFCHEVRREWTETRDLPRRGGNTGSWGRRSNQWGDGTHHWHSESTNKNEGDAQIKTHMPSRLQRAKQMRLYYI